MAGGERLDGAIPGNGSLRSGCSNRSNHPGCSSYSNHTNCSNDTGYPNGGKAATGSS